MLLISVRSLEVPAVLDVPVQLIEVAQKKEGGPAAVQGLVSSLGGARKRKSQPLHARVQDCCVQI